jgi:enoyl-CoA hydratase/carnithine racemase
MVNRVVPLAELPAASLRYATRLSLISPEALYATKRAVNRGADAAGSGGRTAARRWQR